MKYHKLFGVGMLLGIMLISCQVIQPTPIINTVQSTTLPTSVVETVITGTLTSEQIIVPRWLNDNVLWVNLPYPDPIQLTVGQKVAVTPATEGIFDWKLQYDEKILHIVEDTTSIQEATVKWLWNAEQLGKTTITMTSEPPPCEPDATNCSVLPSLILELHVEVIE